MGTGLVSGLGHIMLLMVPPDRGVFCVYCYFILCLIKLSGGNLNIVNELVLAYKFKFGI